MIEKIRTVDQGILVQVDLTPGSWLFKQGHGRSTIDMHYISARLLPHDHNVGRISGGGFAVKKDGTVGGQARHAFGLRADHLPPEVAEAMLTAFKEALANRGTPADQ